MHLVGFILRIYHDARSSECQIRQFFFLCTRHFDISCVCNGTVQQCGNPSLTTFVGYDKLLFEARNGELIQGKPE